MKQVTVLGSTGTIGRKTLAVIKANPERYGVFALAANTNLELLEQQCRLFKPQYAVLRDKSSALELATRLSDLTTTVFGGEDSLCDVASHTEVDIVMAAIVGAAGLKPTLEAVRGGKRVLLANKEALVMSGTLFISEVNRCQATLLPIDSEHNAIYQCLANGSKEYSSGVQRLILTGSGGPFLRLDASNMASVTPEEACAHPNWKMGRKISVDSATMLNKGLELLEAKLLFEVPASTIDIMIHPESIVHSMIEYKDGSIIAHLGNPDMRIPIAHGLAWPERISSSVSALDLSAKDLHFEDPDYAKFPCLAIAREIAEEPQSHFIALNAANEIAVELFLKELISFIDIPIIIQEVLEKTKAEEVNTIEAVLELDRKARELALERISQIT
ncbi:MAG: 1-deoxy-D-xylulose-5-phosphate reductoisomerase [Gammaproteobacteria bacterium TMED133]|nr:MAG: 1-deoxy-D-xylulose-5-phosphate reductoisomerase [Gammaproteobacteria bacterium TMED133]